MVFLGQTAPVLAALPAPVPPLEDSRLMALCKNPCPILPGELGGVPACGSFSSFTPGDTAAPYGLDCSRGGLLTDLVGDETSEGFVGVLFKVAENFELMLDTQDDLRPGVGGF